ncbi:MAG: NAD-dependent epimerase/dehydratase family protein [Prolixibacteraceae bacterium]|jgi:nucleoside-diphosphate-sugar epimerase|nr:NAD-dependent epimerase/dehydratase family protein [Prolixibacteraceae bacterium]
MIFLTGGSGMVGAHLLLDLTRSGVKVRALKRKNSDLATVDRIFSWYTKNSNELFQEIEWIEGDLLDPLSLKNAMEGANCVIHAAAKVSFLPSDRMAMLHENVEGTANLIDVAIELKIKRFCHVSSIAALGDHDSGVPVNEAFSWKNDRQRSAYSESKFQSEMEVWRGVEEGLECVIVNPSVILGPGNWSSGSPRLFQTVAKGMKFYTSGSTGFVEVRDVSHAIVALVQSKEWDKIKNQRFVLSAENLTYRELFDRIAIVLNKPKPAIRANRMLLQLGWRASKLASIFTGKEPALSRDTARSAGKVSLYDGSKIASVIDFEYTPIEATIRDIGKIFLSEQGELDITLVSK